MKFRKNILLPPPKKIEDFLNLSKTFFFPEIYIEKVKKEELLETLSKLLYIFVEPEMTNTVTNIVNSYENHLCLIKEEVILDAVAMYEGDPAANNLTEVIYSYPGFEAILAYRIAHQLYKEKVNLLPRIITEISHSRTGIDIHPEAKIGKSFCIDHGTSLVIGQTAIIGDFVKLYQGVTLGAFSVKKDNIGKRHPTLEDNVTVYARSTILGGNTIIGKNAVIGGNTWITKSVPENAIVYMEQPANQMIKLDNE